jgi:aspartyl-tRNA(Asn)/glutamyl-tRNA(Gln) amidotransferase subunit B
LGETRHAHQEDAADYRYLRPDLPPLMISAWVEKTRAEMTELPRVMAALLPANYGPEQVRRAND